LSSGPPPRRWRSACTALMLTAVLAGCSLLPGARSDSAPTPPATDSTTVGPSPAPTSTAALSRAPQLPSLSVRPLPAPPTPTVDSPGRGLRVGRSRIRGHVARASWDIAIPEFSGAPVAAEANRRVRAAANDLVARVRREAKGDHGVARTLSGAGTVGTDDGRTLQVRIMFSDYLAGTAHPTLYVTTTVIDARTIRPVLLTQVIQNPPEGLRFLRTQVIKAAKNKGDAVDPAGLAPRLANWANWQSTKSGLTFFFGDYQLGGHGIRSYTVPWKSARLVLSAYGEQLLSPR
jgi:hypothetical protein